MAWLHNGIKLKVGKSWSDGNYKHPYNWATAWSAEDKAHWGVTWQDDEDTSYDNRFYWARGVEKNLDDVNVVDEDGNAVIDPTTGVQQVQLGLKSQWIAQTKATAQEKLNKHDWMIIRNAEQSTAIPSEISTYRDAVRSACNTIENSITACSDLEAFKLLFIAPTDVDGNPTANAPIYDFPDEI